MKIQKLRIYKRPIRISSRKGAGNMTTPEQQDYLDRTRETSNNYTKAHNRADNARRNYKKYPTKENLDKYYEALDNCKKADEAYYGR